MQFLKQSTAASIVVGPVLDSAGAAVTSAAIGDFSIGKNGTISALASAATATHSANGYYVIALITGNTDTVGRLDVIVNNTAMSMACHRFTVLLASVYDAHITNATNATGGLLAATGASAWSGAVGSVTGNVGGNVVGSVGSVTGGVTVSTNNDKTGYGLSSGERSTLTATMEAAILNEGDATALLAAIAAKVEQFLINEGDATATLAAIATAVDAAITASHGSGSYATATAAGIRSAVGLASANLDTQLDALPTNSELATALATADDATLTAIVAAKTVIDSVSTEVGKIPRKASAIAAGAAVTKTNTSVTPNETLTEVLS